MSQKQVVGEKIMSCYPEVPKKYLHTVYDEQYNNKSYSTILHHALNCAEQEAVKSFNKDRVWHMLRRHTVYVTTQGIYVNRDYSPTGEKERGWMEYGPFEKSHSNQGVRLDYLFDDGCAPWCSKKDLLIYIEKLFTIVRSGEYDDNNIT